MPFGDEVHSDDARRKPESATNSFKKSPIDARSQNNEENKSVHFEHSEGVNSPDPAVKAS
jgi:hypothetical protein